MKWLGSFKVMAVKDRESVDVNTGERIIIEGRDKISFTPDNILKEIVNKPFAQFETVVVNDGVDFDEIDRKFENAEEEDSEAGNAAETLADIERFLLQNLFLHQRIIQHQRRFQHQGYSCIRRFFRGIFC